jgi:hypothetical protein
MHGGGKCRTGIFPFSWGLGHNSARVAGSERHVTRVCIRGVLVRCCPFTIQVHWRKDAIWWVSEATLLLERDVCCLKSQQLCSKMGFSPTT